MGLHPVVAAGLALALVLAQFGCTGLPAAPKPTASTITVTDVLGRSVSVKARADRIILGEARLLYLVALLDRDDPFKRIVGWPDDLRTADLESYTRYRGKFPGWPRSRSSGRLPAGHSAPRRPSSCGPT